MAQLASSLVAPLPASPDHQARKLARTLTLAATSRYAVRHGLTAHTPLAQWPILTREQLQSDPEALLSHISPRILRRQVITSGSTGQPVTFWLDHSTRIAEARHMLRQWQRVGFQVTHRRVWLHAHVGRTAGAFERLLPVSDVSLLELRSGNPGLDSLVRMLAGAWLHTFPSAALRLAELTSAEQWRSNRPRGLLLGSETVTVEQEERLAAHFGAPVFSWYGLSEKVLLGGECTTSRQYHFAPDYGVPEIVDDHNRPIRTPGVVGRLIGTGLLNSCAPLVRYDTGDLAAWSNQPCGCGLPGPRVDRVLGRSGDFVVTPDGAQVSLVGLELQSHNYAGIKRLQYVQAAPDRLEVRYLGPPMAPGQARALEGELRQLLPGVQVTAVTVDGLQTSPGGKIPLLLRR